MSEGFPEALQVEVTNRCNFNCQICIRRTWNAKSLDMTLDLYKKIAEEAFPRLKRLILYGLGEPFLNPNIGEMLKIARRHLPKESQITISTNGSLLNEHLANKIIETGIDSMSFSIDTIDESILGRIREGSEPATIVKNFRNVAKIKEKAEKEFKLGIEAVIMEDNFRDLPNLVKNSAESSVDYIIVSHVVPYSQEVYEKTLYTTLSKQPLEIIKPSLDYGWRIIREALQELLSGTHGPSVELKSTEIIKGYWERAEKSGYWINIPLLLRSKEKIEKIRQTEEIFSLSRKIAYKYQIDLKLPKIYPDAKERKCPYVEKKTLVIRSDGLAAPCIEFTYPHFLYINTHVKNVHEVSFGDAKRQSVEDIWKRNAYANFRKNREKMALTIPWCGDCPFSTLGCFYIKTNKVDCHANEPGCSECLYSVNLAQCNI